MKTKDFNVIIGYQVEDGDLSTYIDLEKRVGGKIPDWEIIDACLFGVLTVRRLAALDIGLIKDRFDKLIEKDNEDGALVVRDDKEQLPV